MTVSGVRSSCPASAMKSSRLRCISSSIATCACSRSSSASRCSASWCRSVMLVVMPSKKVGRPPSRSAPRPGPADDAVVPDQPLLDLRRLPGHHRLGEGGIGLGVVGVAEALPHARASTPARTSVPTTPEASALR